MSAAMRCGLVVSALVIVVASSSAQAPWKASQERQTALALEEQGQFSKAEGVWRAVLEGRPNSAEAYAHLGLLEARQQHYQAAIPLYREALTLHPEMLAVRLDLGLSLFKSGQFKAAIAAFSSLLKAVPPSSPEAMRLTTLIGIAHYGLGEYAAAIPFLRKVTASEPQNLSSRFLLAQSCLRSKQYQCVLEIYRQIRDLNAESAEADMLVGEAYDEMKNIGAATQEFRAAVKVNPKAPFVHFGLGYMLWSQNQLTEAAQQFEEELANVPDEADAMALLADCKMQLNQPAEALPLLEKAVRLTPHLADPRLARAYLDLGILYSSAGRREEALREMELAAKLQPNDVNVHWQLGKLYMKMGRRDDAKAEFDKAKSLNVASLKAMRPSVFQELHAAQARAKQKGDGTSMVFDK